MNDNQNLSDTLEINVDKARKAVGSLFDDNNGEVNNKKNIDKPDMKRITNLFAKGSAEPSPKPADDKSDLEYPEDDWLTMGSPLRRKSSVPMPKPAIKVNESVTAASRLKLKKPIAPLSMEDEENERSGGKAASPPPPPERAMRSRYLFVDDNEDEFTHFRQKYSDKARTENPEPVVNEHAYVPEAADEPEEQAPRAVSRSNINEEQLSRVQSARRNQPRQQQNRPPMQNVHQEIYGGMDGVRRHNSGIPAPVRILVIGLVVILLAMLTFMIFHVNSINNQLYAANERAQLITAMEYELTRTQLALYAAQEALAAAHAEAAANIPAEWAHEDPYTGYYHGGHDYYGYGHYYGGYDYYPPEQPPAPQAPPPPPADGTNRVHVVVSGDTLYRISVQFFGDGSTGNIDRIMAANNITDANNIQIGMELIIPN